MTGGWDAGTFYDSGTVTVQVSGATAQADWNEGATPASLASSLASAINTSAGGFVSASPSGNSVVVTSLTDGPAADMSISGSVADSNPDYFSTPSFSVSTQNMSGGAFSAGSPLYSFVIPDQGGYDLNGNLLSVTDSVIGQWNYAYDNLNRLTQATAPVSQPTGVYNYYAGVQPTWTYDPFGNRLTETQGKVSGANPTASMPPNVTTTYTATGNQINTTTMGTGITYDAAGDITYDGTNSYLYDAEGRLCAVNNAGALTGYIYDASGIRVAKGSLASFSCNFSSNGYATTSSYVLGPGGEQVTEYNGAGVWQHTNAFVSGALLASYHDTDTYFALNDWLGTKRYEISAGGLTAYCRSLAYGNGLVCSGTAVDATEHHFTGKERDTESGNDYFGARYYSSNLGRFMSPDWSAKVATIPYVRLDDPQSLNLYAYVKNNPTMGIDADGHEDKCDFGCQLNRSWNTLHEITNGTQHDLNDAMWSAKKMAKSAKKTLDAFNATFGFGSTNCSGGGSCAGGVASAAGAIIAGVESGGESEEGFVAKQIRTAGDKIDNIIADHLSEDDLSSAQREVNGGMKIAKEDGTFWDHEGEVRQGMNGLNKQINHLQRVLRRPDVTGPESATINGILTRAQRMLEVAERAVTPKQ